MRILIASSLKRKLIPHDNASRTQIIYELTHGLKKNHEVTVLGTGDSKIEGITLIPVIEKELVGQSFENPFYAETAALTALVKKIEEIGNEFDIIHNHTYPEFLNLLAIQSLNVPMVTTIHAQGTYELNNVLSLFTNAYLISISNAQRKLLSNVHFFETVYNGVDADLFAFSKETDGYMFWAGRLSKAKNKDGSYMDPKGIKWAIELAKVSGKKLKLIGAVEDMDFFEQEVKPNLSENIEWIGPVDPEDSVSREEVSALMQKADVFLMPINWDEPFGLVMAEAMACGTPVIAFNRGSVPEIVADGKTGFVVPPAEGIEGLMRALDKIDTINREDCRKHVEEKFTVDKMVENYEKVYQKIIEENMNMSSTP